MRRKVEARLREVREIVALLNLDYEALALGRNDPEMQLVMVKHKIIRGQITMWYTLIDEFLANIICRYFFGTQRSFPQLWRTAAFRRFNHCIIETLSLLEKLRLVRDIKSLPKAIWQDIERLNALRNGLAHAFFPENLRSLKPLWKGQDVFSIDGLRLLEADIGKITTYFFRRERMWQWG